MRFTKQDAITFGLGALAVAAVVFGEALVKLETEPITNIKDWAVVLGIAEVAAFGRYIITRIKNPLGD